MRSRRDKLTASAAYNLDFWGKYRRATEAARANLLANEWAQKEVTATLVANLATAYFQLRELDLELEISKRTFDVAQRLSAIDADPGATRDRLAIGRTPVRAIGVHRCHRDSRF